MNTEKLIVYILVMAGVTYLIRALPIMLFRKKIKNRFLLSFLNYIPYAVLGAMTVPAVFYSTGSMVSALAGFFVAVLLAYMEKGLLTVAIAACMVVFITEQLLPWICT